MITRPATAGLLAVALVGCVSLRRTPEARFFALRPVAETPPAAAAVSVADIVIVGVLPVSLPGVLDRPQLVAWSGPGEVRIDEFLRWAEPLDSSVQRVLVADLQALLPAHRVIRAPWPRSTPVRYRVRAELLRFGPQAGGDVWLSGRFALLPAESERPLVTRHVSLQRDAGRADTGRAVEAMSALLADLAAQVADAATALPSDALEKPLAAAAAPPSPN
jgi:uncharacterized lipoprotein YmbA